MTTAVAGATNLAVEELRQLFLERLHGAEDKESFGLWTVPGEKGTLVYEVGIGAMVHWIPESRLLNLFELGKLQEWVDGIITRYQRKRYEQATFRRIEVQAEVNRVLCGIARGAPVQWRERLAVELADKVRETFGDQIGATVGKYMFENRILVERIQNWIAPKAKTVERS